MENKKNIREGISESAISPLTYIVFVDSFTCIDKSRGYLKMLFPSETPDTIRTWYKSLINSPQYASEKEKLQAVSSRFSNNPSLKALINSLQKLVSMSYVETQKDSHEDDIQSMIQKISIFVKRRLTDQDDVILQNFLSELNSATEKISNKLDNDIAKLSTPEDESEKKDESKISERMKNKLRKKIKEIIRTNLISNRYR